MKSCEICKFMINENCADFSITICKFLSDFAILLMIVK